MRLLEAVGDARLFAVHQVGSCCYWLPLGHYGKKVSKRKRVASRFLVVARWHLVVVVGDGWRSLLVVVDLAHPLPCCVHISVFRKRKRRKETTSGEREELEEGGEKTRERRLSEANEETWVNFVIIVT